MCSMYDTVYKILPNQITCRKCHLKNKGQRGEKQDFCHSSENALIYVGDFSDIYLAGNIRLRKRLQIHTYTQ